jgi:hypothetical protein
VAKLDSQWAHVKKEGVEWCDAPSKQFEKADLLVREKRGVGKSEIAQF